MTRPRRTPRPSLLVPVLLLSALAGPSPAAAAPIVAGETVRIPSKILGEERTLFVATPDGYARGAEKYPVLFLTDAETQFEETRATADVLRRNGFMPAVLVVGVASTDRVRDLTPTRSGWKDASGGVRPLPTRGGADRFLDFFEKELVPWVEANYRTVPFRIFCGHSLGGLFGIHALLTRPDLFQAVVALSPALAWDGGLEIRRAASVLAATKALKRTLFVTTGAEGPSSRADLDALVKVVGKSRPEGFRFGSADFPEEDHFSAAFPGRYAGLRMIFEGWHIPRKDGIGDLQPGSLADLKARFAAVSEKTGFSFQPPEALLRLLARQAQGRGEPERALELLRYDVEIHPDSPEAREALAAALEKAGKPGGP